MGIKRNIKSWLKHLIEKLLEEKTPVLLVNNSYVEVGNKSYHNGNFNIRGRGRKVVIGSYCAIGKDVKLILNNHPIEFAALQYSFYTSYFKTLPKKTKKAEEAIYIGSDVWIGDNVVILPDVTIGHGCVIGAGSVVTKSIPPYTIIAGVPAKKIKMRFDEATVKKMLESEWWTWSESEIKNNKAFFFKDNTISDGN
ncbi:CatB-related O-acetyltransferase [Hyunsoonleella ulvae]|nr:CatB-related O-acetyltransferase [Hyunsoonleella ulvae]